MSDFNSEDLLDTVDGEVRKLLQTHGIHEPPVDTLTLVQEAFQYTIHYLEDEEPEVQGRFGPKPMRRKVREVTLRCDQSEEAQQVIAGRACAQEMIPHILLALGITPGTEQRGATNQLSGLILPRLLLPTRWFAKDAPRLNYDLERLKEKYNTVSYELIALRLLDLDEPCVIAVVDDKVVGTRRGCLIPVTKKLTTAEKICVERVLEAREAVTVRRDGWTARGWPIPTGPYNRIILRSVPDDL